MHAEPNLLYILPHHSNQLVTLVDACLNQLSLQITAFLQLHVFMDLLSKQQFRGLHH